MDLNQLESLLSLSATPGFVLILGIYFFFEFKAMKKDHSDFRAEFKEEMEKIHNNGFVRKDILQEKEKHANDVHEELSRRISLLEGERRESHG